MYLNKKNPRDIYATCTNVAGGFLCYTVDKVPHRYAVHGSDTTMLTIDKMLVKKLYSKKESIFFECYLIFCFVH